MAKTDLKSLKVRAADLEERLEDQKVVSRKLFVLLLICATLSVTLITVLFIRLTP